MYQFYYWIQNFILINKIVEPIKDVLSFVVYDCLPIISLKGCSIQSGGGGNLIEHDQENMLDMEWIAD